MSAYRLTISGAEAGLEERLFEVLAGIPASWTRSGRDLALWVEGERLDETRRALSTSGIAFDERPEEARDWVAEAAALQKAVVVGRYLLDPHEGARATPEGKRVRLHVPAERAFGTGSHESTRIALRLLLTLRLAGRRVLDAGCGAGTLAFVAAREGASCVALDIDPDAAFATRAGALRNGAAVPVLAGPIEALSRDVLFDVVVANMIAEELAPLLPSIAARTRPGGRLVTSGQLAEREPDWTLALQAAGYDVSGREAEGEWVGFTARRR